MKRIPSIAGRRIVSVTAVFLLSSGLMRAQDLFRYTVRNYADYGPTLVGNGALSGASPWNGAIATETTLAGLYDHLQENSYVYQPLIPAWNEIDYFNGSHWLNQASPAAASLSGYVQTLDAFRGVLDTRYEWTDSDRTTRIETTSFAARQERHLGVVRMDATPDYGVTAGPVTFSFPLGGPRGTHFVWEGAALPGALPITSLEPDSDGRGFVAIAETRDHKSRVAEAVRVLLPHDLLPHEELVGISVADPQKPSLNVKFIVNRGETYRFVKLVAVVSSLESQSFVEDARSVAAAAERAGFETILAAHEKVWEDLWGTDIRIEGDVEAQRAVHAAMFYLYSSLRPDIDASIPAVGIPSRAYLGRIWWDADTFVFPALLVLNPTLARSIVSYRCERLGEAQRNATMRGYRGALFPMESARTGSEAAPEWSSEIHVTGDVALAQWRYFLNTGDLAWLRRCAFPILREVADFWVSRASDLGGSGRYGILDVTGPNEAITHVNNDAYTNAIARRVLEVAAEAARLTGANPNPDWTRTAREIVIPFDAQKGHHLEHDGDAEGSYAHALPLLIYPLEMDFPVSVERNDLQLALRNFGKPGYEVGMFGNFYSVIASQLGERDLAYRLFLDMLRSYAKPPFYAMAETPSNNRFVFLTAEGAFLQQIIFGFTGLRFSSDGLTPKYPPLLPPTWQSLELRNVNIRGKRHTIRVERGGKLTIE